MKRNQRKPKSLFEYVHLTSSPGDPIDFIVGLMRADQGVWWDESTLPEKLARYQTDTDGQEQKSPAKYSLD